MSKAKVTRTYGPIHFEDLDPHRFEFLIGDLIYDFRDWQVIESTGLGGSDDGFDIRAREKNSTLTNRDENDNESSEGVHPMDGNLWMVQCKREKEIGPKKIKEIINDNVKKGSVPYGYILVAPANFSKKSYDLFYEELRKKGVMEFYLWGNSDLEHMLHMPKYDHILFAFFGISLATRKKSRSSEIKFGINNKNKLLKCLTNGEQTQSTYKSVFVRDINDEHYPYEDAYSDFKTRPRWQEHIVFGYHPLGLLTHIKKYRGYIDVKKKKFDFIEEIDLINRKSDEDEKGDRDLQSRMEFLWENLPRENKIELAVEGMIFYDDMLVIDDKGHFYNNYPHIFTEFRYNNTPFGRVYHFAKRPGEDHVVVDLKDKKYKKINFFPDKFPEIKRGTIHKEKLVVNAGAMFALRRSGFKNFFDTDGKLDFLNYKDVFCIESLNPSEEGDVILAITHRYETTVKKYKKDNTADYNFRDLINSLAGRVLKDTDKITVFEISRIYDYKIADQFREKQNSN